MRIPSSVRDLYGRLLPNYKKLETVVGDFLRQKKENRWHYEARIKEIESFAQKLETGRVEDPERPDDLFACTLVVENHGRIAVAEKLVEDSFTIEARKPVTSSLTPLGPFDFNYDDLRMYVTWKDTEGQQPSGLTNLLFEIQIKTYLQHAWAIATHELVYKTDEVSWSKSRIAFQAKAMLENTELSISEANRLTDSPILAKEDTRSAELRSILDNLSSRWESALLPKDRLRLGQNVGELCFRLKLNSADVFSILDQATARGEGAHTLHLSPYGSILAALVQEKRAALFEPLKRSKSKYRLFIPREIVLPNLSEEILAKLVRT